MKRVSMSFLLALLSVFMAVPGCGWWQKHVDPVIPAVVTCSGKTIPAGLVTEVYQDIMTENWADLAMTVIPNLPNAWADVVCIYDALKNQNPQLAPHMEKLKAQHVELRVALLGSGDGPRDCTIDHPCARERL